MGSIRKVIKKVTRAVKKPVSKAFKGVAKGIMKVGKATMRGVAKLNKKLGPLGSIALAVAMPYALSGLGSGITALQGSQYKFLQAIGNVGNSIRNGYQGFNTFLKGGQGKPGFFKSITNSISEGFKKFAPKNLQNTYSEISQGAKNLFQAAKDTVKKYSPKVRTGKTGTVEVFGTTDPGVSVISSTDAAAAIDKGTLKASQLGKQTLSEAGGYFTKANAAGVKSDKLVTETINKAYQKRLEGFGPNATQMFNDVKQRTLDIGTYINDEEIGSFVENNIATTRYSVQDVIGDTEMYGTGPYNIKTEISDLSATGDYVDNGQGGFRFTGDKTFSSEPVKQASSNLSKAVKKSVFDYGKSLLKPSDEKIDPYYIAPTQDMTMQTSTGGYGGTEITGTAGGDFFTKVYGEDAGRRLQNYYKNMNLIGSMTI
jgi:ribosomal protein S20